VEDPTLNILILPRLEHAPPLIETSCSTNELWMLYKLCVLGFI
jgi:hypothetical protein